MNRDNNWNVGSPVVCVCRDEVVQALNEMNTVITLEPSDALLELIAVIGEV